MPALPPHLPHRLYHDSPQSQLHHTVCLWRLQLLHLAASTNTLAHDQWPCRAPSVQLPPLAAGLSIFLLLPLLQLACKRAKHRSRHSLLLQGHLLATFLIVLVSIIVIVEVDLFGVGCCCRRCLLLLLLLPCCVLLLLLLLDDACAAESMDQSVAACVVAGDMAGIITAPVWHSS
jgi:hypothetical protein